MRKKEINSDRKKSSESRTGFLYFFGKKMPKPIEMIHRTKNNTEKQIIIDLDDAYGVPFSSASFHIQEE